MTHFVNKALLMFIYVLNFTGTEGFSNQFSIRIPRDINYQRRSHSYLLTTKDSIDVHIEKDVDNDEDSSKDYENIMKGSIDNQLNSFVSSMPEYVPTLALCWFVGLLSSLDRVAMSVAILPLSDEYHLTDTIKGEISSVFSVGYGLGIIPVGLLVSSVSPRTIMASGVTLWSLATFGTPIAASFIHIIQTQGSFTPDEVATSAIYMAENIGPLLLIRSIMGAAESVVLPAIQRILANWIPSSKKSIAIATILSGFQLGTVLAYLVSPWVMENFGGWRGLFYLYGLIGALWLVPWWTYAKDAPGLEDNDNGDMQDNVPILVNAKMEDDISLVVEHHKVGENGTTSPDVVDVKETLSMALAEIKQLLKDAPWRDLSRSKAVWGMTLAHAANNWGLYNSLSWTPTFYSQQYGLNVKESAFLSILPSIAGAFGGLSAGFIADKVIASIDDESNSEKRTIIRKTFQAIALFGPASCLIAISSNIPEDAVTAQFLLMGTVGLQAFNAAGYGAGPQEKAGEKWGGLLYSITSLPGVIFGSVGVYATGQILDATNQNWSGVFGLNAAIDILGGLAFVLLYNSKKEFE